MNVVCQARKAYLGDVFPISAACEEQANKINHQDGENDGQQDETFSDLCNADRCQRVGTDEEITKSCQMVSGAPCDVEIGGVQVQL